MLEGCPSFVQHILAHPAITLLATRSEGQQTVHLLACHGPGKRACFVLVYWQGEAMLQADLLFTQAEARARLEHGEIYDLEVFALPPSILHCLTGTPGPRDDADTFTALVATAHRSRFQ